MTGREIVDESKERSESSKGSKNQRIERLLKVIFEYRDLKGNQRIEVGAADSTTKIAPKAPGPARCLYEQLHTRSEAARMCCELKADSDTCLVHQGRRICDLQKVKTEPFVLPSQTMNFAQRTSRLRNVSAAPSAGCEMGGADHLTAC